MIPVVFWNVIQKILYCQESFCGSVTFKHKLHKSVTIRKSFDLILRHSITSITIGLMYLILTKLLRIFFFVCDKLLAFLLLRSLYVSIQRDGFRVRDRNFIDFYLKKSVCLKGSDFQAPKYPCYNKILPQE